MPPAEASASMAVAPASTGGSTRRMPRWLLLLTLILIAARVVTGIREDRSPPERPELVQWRTPATGLAEARRTGRPLLYDFTADWCTPCRKMQSEVFADERSAQAINTMFVPVRVLDRMREDGSNIPEVAELQHRFGVDAFPTLVIVRPDAGEPVSIDGYPGKTALMSQLVEVRRRMGGATLPTRGLRVRVDTTRGRR